MSLVSAFHSTGKQEDVNYFGEMQCHNLPSPAYVSVEAVIKHKE